MNRTKRRLERWDAPAPVRGQRPQTLAARADLNERGETLWRGVVAGIDIELRRGRDSLWIVLRVLGRPGGVALRGLYSPDGDLTVDAFRQEGDVLHVRAIGSSMGAFRASMTIVDAEIALVRWRVWLTPATNLLMPPQPWNIHPLDADGDPTTTRGIVHATQRGTAAGVLYFTMTDPPVGSLFYLQNLTALNDYCTWTHTSAESIVRENWPGLGFMPPPSDEHSLPGGVEVSLCDAYGRLDPRSPTDETESARYFLESLAAAYRDLPKPPTRDHDWPAMAAATRRDLECSSKLSLEEHGYLYLRPYTSAEYPDSMVQLAVLLPLMEYARWLGVEDDPLVSRLRAAVPNFFDAKLGTIRRYLATVGDDKEADQVDSWYLYHPMVNLGRLALDGDADAKALFLRSLAYGIHVAHHFEYEWPVMYDVVTLDVITGDRKEGELGQTDVPGLYAYVMHQAYQLTRDERYLNEAIAALNAMAGLGFQVGYQFNNVAWGVAACLRVWRESGDRKRLAQADVLLASFMHNVNLWECDFGPAEHYVTFMGVTCLHDGPYMAAYEEFEAFAAFHECLQLGGGELSAASRLLMSEYCRYALDRGWCYYPGELPRHILSPEVRNGHVDRSLAIPLEDLYADWTPPGGVGQEVYGAGMAFSFVARSFCRVPGATFLVYCDYPLRDFHAATKHVQFRVDGDPQFACRLLLIPTGAEPVPDVRVEAKQGNVKSSVEGTTRRDRAIEYAIDGGDAVTICWCKS